MYDRPNTLPYNDVHPALPDYIDSRTGANRQPDSGQRFLYISPMTCTISFRPAPGTEVLSDSHAETFYKRQAMFRITLKSNPSHEKHHKPPKPFASSVNAL
jgi:hypothetical protein